LWSNERSEIALLILDESIGYKTGWLGLCAPDENLDKLNVFFPGYSEKGTLHKSILKRDKNVFDYH